MDKRQSKKAVLYARKSTESEDKQVQSIDDQIRIMQEVAHDEGLELVEILSESKSAKEPGVRMVFEEMMTNIKKGKYNVILAWDTSRLSRNAKDGGDLQWLLDSGALSGIRTHEKWYRDSDDLLFTIENSMNSRYVKELKVKVKRGMDSKADKGDFPAQAPIGYRNDYYDKKVVKDPENWDKVAALWRKALTGVYNVSELTKIANEELRIRRPVKKRSGGAPLCYNGVHGILTNPFYAGKFRWGGKIYNGNHPPMVTETEFEQIQEILKPKCTTRPKKEPYRFLLRGILTCSECGYAIVTEEKIKKLKDGSIRKHRYCHCGDKHPTCRCKNRSIYIREDDLIQQIKDELSKYTIDEDFFKIAVEALAEEDDIAVAEQNEKITKYNQQITRKKTELDNLRRSVYKGIITDNAFFLSEQELLSKDIEALQAKRDKVMVSAKNWRETAMDIFMFARYAKEDFDSDDWERKRAVIKHLGADLKLSGRTIQFTSVKYLIPIEKIHQTPKQEIKAGRTNSQQMKKDLKEDLISSWYTR